MHWHKNRRLKSSEDNPVTVATQPVESTVKDPSDLAKLWNEAIGNEAVAEFEERTGESLRIASLGQVIEAAHVQQESFARNRHNDSKTDRARSAFGASIQHMKKVLSMAQGAADLASAVVPPAMAVAPLVAALTYVLKTFEDNKADNDRIEEFFSVMGSFLDRISMLENKIPDSAPFQRCVRQVFSSMFKLCGIAAEMAKVGRWKQWLHALKDGSGDQELADEYGKMETAIKDLQSAVNLATLSFTIEVNSKVTTFTSKLNTVLEFNEAFEKSTTELKTTNLAILNHTGTMSQEISEIKLFVKAIDASLRPHTGVTTGDSPQGQKDKQKSSSDKTKEAASSKNEGQFAKLCQRFADTSIITKKSKAREEDRKFWFVEDTAKWFLQEAKYKAWLDGRPKILWVTGPQGIGKTFLAHATVDNLIEQYKHVPRTSVAHFFFSQEEEELRSFGGALRCAVLRIAEQDPIYCRQVMSEIERNEGKDSWEQFFAHRYSKTTEARLFFVLDGIDESSVQDQATIFKLSQKIEKEDLNIHLLITSRPHLISTVPEAAVATMNVTKWDMQTDMAKLTIARCRKRAPRALDKLRAFHPRFRKRMRRVLLEHADGMLFVDSMLRRWNIIGRQTSVLKDIERGIPSNVESLHKLLVAECQKGRTREQHTALRTFFCMLAFSQRPLTLDEATELMIIYDPKQTISIEDEINGRCTRLLYAHHGEDEDDEEEDADEYEEHDQHDEHNKHERDESASDADKDISGQVPLRFRNRSLKEFFRESCVEEDSLRVPPATAHCTIFLICVDCLCGNESPRPNTRSEMTARFQTYAVRYWADHFVNIDFDNVDNEQLRHVLSRLSKLLSNQNNVSVYFEKEGTFKYQVGENYGYSLLNERTKFLEKVIAIVKRVLGTDPDSLEDKTRIWAEKALESTINILLPLAKGHVLNWRRAQRSNAALNSCFLAHNALNLVNAGIVDHTESPGEAIRQVASYLSKDIDEDAEMLRVIGSALLGVDETEAAIDYCLRSIKKSGEGTENAFYAHWIIANAYHRQDIFEQAMEHHQFALKTLPPSWKEHPENLKDAEGVAWILDQLASCHQHNNQPDLAIQTYNESKRIDPDKSPFSIGYTLERIVNVRQWDEITDEYFDMLKSWTKEERNAWLEYQSTWMWYGEFENLIRLAKLSGPPNIDFVIRCLEDYISTKKRGNTRTIAPLMGLERLYDLVMDDKVTALQTCSRILEDMGDADVDLEWILVIVRSWKARLLFNHFRTSSDVSIKKDLLVQMITLSTFQIGNATDDDIRQGRLNITLAMMKRSLGYKLEFQELVEECFRSCKRTLSDTIGSNDSSSLRLLSRLLACLPGLEWDAQVAMTCQLYITDPNVKHDFDSDDDSSLSEQSHSANIDPQDQSTTSYQADDIKSTTENLDHSLGTSSQSGVLGTMPNVATETTLSGLESVDSNTIRDHSSNDREHEDLRQDPVTKTGSPERQSSNPTTVSEAESARQKLVYPLEADEGLRPEGQRGAYCDGKCGRTLKTWAEPWYICVHCDDTDLCTSCLNTRRAMNRGEPCPSWEPWCGQNHAYIRGPVQGWRGIRAGVMRIIKDVDYGIAEVTAVEAIEDIPFKQWLEDLEMIKLPRAWKRFWEGEDFLKDIGM